jgi:2-polyprenyl-3-methyl-5-hydroxy-6-metoxy-1,4-benzoquinol methylase
MQLNKRNIKTSLYRILQSTRILPSVWMMRNPIKIHEYYQVVSGSSLQKHHVILDLGCGKGFQTQMLARRCESAIGVDINERPISEANRFLSNSCVEHKVSFLCTRIEEANLPPSSFDRIFSFCVLEHIPNLRSVLTEIARLLKPGGELHVSVDSLATVKDAELLTKHRLEHFVVQYFTKETLKRQLETSGLEVMDIFPILTSDYARKEFEMRIRQTPSVSGPITRMLRYKRFRDEDTHSLSSEGIMIVGRARRPLASDRDEDKKA